MSISFTAILEKKLTNFEDDATSLGRFVQKVYLTFSNQLVI